MRTWRAASCPAPLLRREDLDPGIWVCLEARDACRGLEIIGVKIDKVRTGNFFLDFLNFERNNRYQRVAFQRRSSCW